MSLYSKDHTVYRNRDGKEIPSVTTVLKLLNKPALIGWANYLGFKRTRVTDVLLESANIGTDFHAMVSDWSEGKTIIGEHYDVAIALFKEFLVWAEKNEMRPIKSEISMQCDRFGGTIDSICHIGSTVHMLDFKTSKNIYPSMFLQLAGYSLLCKENAPETYGRIEKFTILSISEKNGIQTKSMEKKVIEERFVPTFLSLLDTFEKWFALNMEFFDSNITKE